ncbi:hypothetical protein DER45DRAFT_179499 [Fusarium avenaceum]|nr:hypothetical protein DER45DRAFT_179499 [Fusarium avenaceum]
MFCSLGDTVPCRSFHLPACLQAPSFLSALRLVLSFWLHIISVSPSPSPTLPSHLHLHLSEAAMLHQSISIGPDLKSRSPLPLPHTTDTLLPALCSCSRHSVSTTIMLCVFCTVVCTYLCHTIRCPPRTNIMACFYSVHTLLRAADCSNRIHKQKTRTPRSTSTYTLN